MRAIAFAAPFLGLAGTCYGILEGFYGLGYQKYGGLGSIMADIGGALVTTAAGLIVALPAAVSYNALRTRLEKFEIRSSVLLNAASDSCQVAQTLPLRRRFSELPAFALIGAPVLALLIPMFALMPRSQISVGLPVRLLNIGVSDRDSGPIVIRVTSDSPNDPATALVNSKATPWSELRNTLRSRLEVRPHWIVYVEGEDDASWQDVVNVIDIARGLHAEVVLLTVAPRDDIPKTKTKKARHQ